MPNNSGDAAKHARDLVDATAAGQNPDCLFQSLSNADKMATYRALRDVQNPNDNIPDLTLYIGQGEGYHIYKQGQEPSEGFCRERVQPRKAPRQEQGRTEGDLARAEFERIRREHAPEMQARERERVEHPEEPARRIENLADRAISGDEQARLDLRRSLESLMGDRNKDYRDAVLGQMVKDGAYKAFKDAPHVTVSRDASGRPESITFGRNLGFSEQTIPLNQSVDQQVNEAQKGYVDALRKVVGGLGKFDTEGTLRAYDILEGAEPTNLRWFMLYRKEQGRPAVDLENRN
ncbi:MAG: hypothetical protein KC777_09600 [Cyanobacteria bacterium HKST-UBA02]|nr:hypothetical protein [Cyanobacteria bacterium HKST-UBA02]